MTILLPVRENELPRKRLFQAMLFVIRSDGQMPFLSALTASLEFRECFVRLAKITQKWHLEIARPAANQPYRYDPRDDDD